MFIFVLLILQDLYEIYAYKFVAHLVGPLISIVRKVIITTLMASKKIQVVHVNKDNDKIVITQSTHNTTMGPMTRSKAKSISSPSTKQTSESTCLLKP